MRHYQDHLNDEAGTLALGAALARAISPGLTIYLHGDLGAGKTTLARALLHAAGFPGHVKSPTYTLAEPYSVTIGGQPGEVVHFDLYRMGSPEEFLDAGFREHFDGSKVCIIEWPERGEPVLPPADIDIKLVIEGNGRNVELNASSARGLQCLDRLRFAPNL